MPSSFGTGLATGILSGWSEQQSKQDDIKRQQKQDQIQNNLSIINARDVPDDVRQNAAQQLQDLMQGKKPGGKSQGGLSPVLKNLLHMVGKSHEADGGQGGQQGPVMPGASTGTASNDRSQPGQPQTATMAPGQGPSSRMPIPGLNQDAGGFERGPGVRPEADRPSLSRPTTNSGAVFPAPASGMTQPIPQMRQAGGDAPQQSTRQTQIQNLQAALANTSNYYTKERLQKRIQDLQDDQAKSEDQAALEQEKSVDRAETARIRAQAALEKQQAEDKHKDELAAAVKVSKEAAQAEKERFQKEMADLSEKHKEEMRAYNVAHPLPSKAKAAGAKRTPGAPTAATYRSINTWKENQFSALNKQLADAVAKGSMTRAAAANLRKTREAEIQQTYLNKIRDAKGGGSGEAESGQSRKDYRQTKTDTNGKQWGWSPGMPQWEPVTAAP